MCVTLKTWRQLEFPGVVTNRINSRNVGILILVHNDIALAIGFYAHLKLA